MTGGLPPPHGESTLEHLRSNALEVAGTYELHESDIKLFLSTWGINPDPNLPEEEVFKALEAVENFAQPLAVVIDNKAYFFMPKDQDEYLKMAAMVGASSGQVVEDENGYLQLNGKKYSFDLSAVPDAMVTYSQGTADDFDYITQKTDENGQLLTSYYKYEKKANANKPDITSINVNNGLLGLYGFIDDDESFDYVTGDIVRKVNSGIDIIGRGMYDLENPMVYVGDVVGNKSSFGGGIFGDFPAVIYGNFIDNQALLGGGMVVGGFHEGKAAYALINGGFYGNKTVDDKGLGFGGGGAILDYLNIYPAYMNSYIKAVTGADIKFVPGSFSVIGDFVDNSVNTDGVGGGGAIFSLSKMGNIEGNFYSNTVKGKNNAAGGAIANLTGVVTEYITMRAHEETSIEDLAKFFNKGNMTSRLNSNFINNSAVSENGTAHGGAIFTNPISGCSGSNDDMCMNRVNLFNTPSLELYTEGKDILFSDNYTQDIRGKIYNGISLGHWSTNVFIMFQRWMVAEQEKGTVFSEDFQQQFDKITDINDFFVILSHPEAKSFWEIYDPSLKFNTSGGGAIVFNDNIDTSVMHMDGSISDNEATMIATIAGIKLEADGSLPYTIDIVGDAVFDEDGKSNQYVAFNNDIIGAKEVNVENTTLKFGAYQHKDQTAINWDGKGTFAADSNADGTINTSLASITALNLKNAAFDTNNGYMETVGLKGYSSDNSFWHLDIDTNNMTADKLEIDGDVVGQTKLMIHASGDDDIRGKGAITFASSVNDTTGNVDSFKVARVYKSPYLYDVVYQNVGENANEWGVAMNDTQNSTIGNGGSSGTTGGGNKIPMFAKMKVAPEVMAYQSLNTIATTQTNSMVGNVMRKTILNHLYCPTCGFYDYNWNGDKLNNAWVEVNGFEASVDSPFNVEAKVWGVEAGFDLQSDLRNKLGLFVSYRRGNYEMNGDGEKYYSPISSEVNTDSYVGGLYYLHDNNNWYTFATLYGGLLYSDLTTKDGVSAKTDGIQYGGSLEIGYRKMIFDKLGITPNVGISYVSANYDDIEDEVGRVIEYSDMKQAEVKAGVKVSYDQFWQRNYSNVYIEPGIARTFTDGHEVEITELGKVKTAKNQTLGYVELGINYGLENSWSVYGTIDYMFGKDYEAVSVNAGTKYSW